MQTISIDELNLSKEEIGELGDGLYEKISHLLQNVAELQNTFSIALDKVSSENKILSDTIKQYKLGTLHIERKELLNEVASAQKEYQDAYEEAEKIKQDYENKVNEIAPMLEEVMEKQNTLDLQVSAKVEAELKKIKEAYEEKKKRNNAILIKRKKECELALEEEKNKTKKFMIIGIIIGIIGIVVGIIGFCVKF